MQNGTSTSTIISVPSYGNYPSVDLKNNAVHVKCRKFHWNFQYIL